MATTKVTRNMLNTGIVDNSNATAITIDSSENVAIGHTTTTGSKFAICDGANSQIQFFPEISTDTNLTQHYDPTAAVYINSETRAASHAWKIGTSEKMRIDASGNVGIGQNNPTSPNDATDFLHIGSASNQDTSIVLQDAVEIWEIYQNDNLSFRYDTNNVMTLQRLTGNVGIGTTSPATQLQLLNAGESMIRMGYSTTQYAQIGRNSDGTYEFSCYENGGVLKFGTSQSNNATTERMRITSTGAVGIGPGSATTTYLNAAAFVPQSTNNPFLYFNTDYSGGTITKLSFARNGTSVGSITSTASATAYNTSSDYRLKENVVEIDGAIDRVKLLQPKRFNFIVAPEDTVDGFIAHEVQDIVPEAITGVKDEMQEEEYEVTPAVLDEDGSVVTEAVMGTREVPKYQGIDQSKLVPLLTKAIQEQQTLIEQLQAEVALLKGE